MTEQFGDEAEEVPAHTRRQLNRARNALHTLEPRGLEPRDWSRIAVAYELIRSVGDDHGHLPGPVEEAGDYAPRRWRCDVCRSVLLSRVRINPPRESDNNHRNPGHCPFCSQATPTQVEGYELAPLEGPL